MSHRFLAALMIPAALALLLSGCGRTAMTRFYSLSPLTRADAAPGDLRPLGGQALGIGPVTLADYLDRPQIVVRTSPNELRLAEFDKWAGTLKNEVPQVIAENLSVLLDTDQVFTFPWKSGLPIRYQVVIDIQRFDAQPGAHVDLQALWTVFENDGRTPLATRKSAIRSPLAGAGYAAVVQVESQALAALSREIAAALSEIDRTHPPRAPRP